MLLTNSAAVTFRPGLWAPFAAGVGALASGLVTLELNPELEEGFDEDKYIYEVDPSAVTISTSDDSVPVPVSRVEPIGAVISVQSVTTWAAP